MPRMLHGAAGALAAAALVLLVACGGDQLSDEPLAAAREQIQRGDLSAAQDSLQRAIAADPNQAEAYLLLATIHGELNQPPEAILNFGKALALDPGDFGTLTLRGTAYLELGEPEHALVDFGRAILGDPDDLTAYVLRGETRARLGRVEGALVDADVVIGRAEQDDLRGRALWLRGTVRLNAGAFDAGIADLTRLIELDPDDVDAYLARGRARAAQGRFDDAMADFQQALAVSPDNPVPLLDVATLLLLQDRLDEARQTLDEATERLPDQSRLRLIRGEHAARAGDVQRARAELEAAIAMAANEPAVAARASALLDQLIGR